MDYIQRSAITTCFMYGGPTETKAVQELREKITWPVPDPKGPKRPGYIERVDEDNDWVWHSTDEDKEFKRDLLYLILELREALEEWEADDVAYSPNLYDQLERYGNCIRKEYHYWAQAIARLYRGFKPLVL